MTGQPDTESGPLRLLRDDEACRIVHLAGDNGMAIVSFAGVGYALGGMQIEEFRKSLDGTNCDIYFVTDKQRHWYNGTYDAIVATLNGSLSERRIKTTFTLGNSMGGFGAIVFAGALRHCFRAVAFCPQSSVYAVHAPFENRWPEWVGTIADWRVPDAIPHMIEGIDYVLFFGDREPRDLLHADRFAAAPKQPLLCVVENCAHGVAGHIKGRGALAPLLGALLTKAPINRRRLGSLLGDIRHSIRGGGEAPRAEVALGQPKNC